VRLCGEGPRTDRDRQGNRDLPPNAYGALAALAARCRVTEVGSPVRSSPCRRSVLRAKIPELASRVPNSRRVLVRHPGEDGPSYDPVRGLPRIAARWRPCWTPWRNGSTCPCGFAARSDDPASRGSGGKRPKVWSRRPNRRSPGRSHTAAGTGRPDPADRGLAAGSDRIAGRDVPNCLYSADVHLVDL
jgi:hypothetical protein